MHQVLEDLEWLRHRHHRLRMYPPPTDNLPIWEALVRKSALGWKTIVSAGAASQVAYDSRIAEADRAERDIFQDLFESGVPKP
eukprot:4875524-Pyramimonas_sp.AAC.1